MKIQVPSLTNTVRDLLKMLFARCHKQTDQSLISIDPAWTRGGDSTGDNNEATRPSSVSRRLLAPPPPCVS